MRLRMLMRLFCLCIAFSCLPLRATHIIGGELYYDCLGNDNYQITLKVYRDCINGQAPFDNPASITVWDSNGNFVRNINLPFPGSTNVPFVPNSPCFQAPPNVCVEEAVYTFQVNLPNINQGITLAYQRCCRNNSIVNLVNPGSTGSTYVNSMPPVSLAACNSSPRFTNFPPIAICLGDTLQFDHSATDPDGDSLAYALCATYHGGSVANPMPIPTSAPPFTPITFQPPFSQQSPLASNPPIQIDPITGLLTAVPNQIGQYVVGVCVNEYRNGQLLGTHQRDFQFNITNCQVNTVSDFDLSIPVQQAPDGSLEICGPVPIPFQNNSINASSYFWDFGDQSQTNDTSSAQNPTYTYPGVGSYVIQLISNPGYFCADTSSQTLVIKDPVSLSPLSFPTLCIDNAVLQPMATGNLPTGTNFVWDFQGASPASSNQNPPGVVSYSAIGAYPIRLSAEYEGCVDSVSTVVQVAGHPTLDLPPAEVGCTPLLINFQPIINPNNNQLTYFWDFGNGTTAQTAQGQAVYQEGTWQAEFTMISQAGCRDTLQASIPITVYPIPQAGISVSPEEQSVFEPNFTFFNESVDNISCIYGFGDGTELNLCPPSVVHSYDTAGTYMAYVIATNEFGCNDTATIPVRVLPEYSFYVPNTLTPNGDGINELFKGYGIGIDSYVLRVFNRWGELLFETNDLSEGWDGTYEGALCPQGSYVYAVDLTNVFGRFKRYRGMVLLLPSPGSPLPN